MDRTTRWLERCKREMARLNSLPDTINKEQLLFGINQGGVVDSIRIQHAKTIADMDLDGYAVGGLAVGETHEEMYHILDVTVPHLPQNKPTYLMGVGTPANILEAVDRGVDFFDCVYPSRNGRHSHVYTNHGKLNLLNQKYELDPRPIEEGCQCPACRSYSRAYIRHLFKAKEMLGMRLCVLHNLYFYNKMMEEIRDAIEQHRYAEYKAQKLAGMEAGQSEAQAQPQGGQHVISNFYHEPNRYDCVVCGNLRRYLLLHGISSAEEREKESRRDDGRSCYR